MQTLREQLLGLAEVGVDADGQWTARQDRTLELVGTALMIGHNEDILRMWFDGLPGDDQERLREWAHELGGLARLAPWAAIAAVATTWAPLIWAGPRSADEMDRAIKAIMREAHRPPHVHYRRWRGKHWAEVQHG